MMAICSPRSAPAPMADGSSTAGEAEKVGPGIPETLVMDMVSSFQWYRRRREGGRVVGFDRASHRVFGLPVRGVLFLHAVDHPADEPVHPVHLLLRLANVGGRAVRRRRVLGA